METSTKGFIEKKVHEGKEILQELETMRKRDGAAFNVVYYVTDDVERYRSLITKWQMTSKEILINEFGEGHRFVVSFNETITRKNTGFDYKQEFKSVTMFAFQSES